VRRRRFITLLGGAAAWPLAARAQPSDGKRRVGVLLALTKDDPEDQGRRALFQQELQRFGWTEGSNLLIEYRWFAGEPARAQAMAKELVELQPDLIITVTTPALAAVRQETHTIPIVFVAVSDPVGQGFVTNLARPGGNATGFTFFEFSVVGKMLEALKQIAPEIVEVAVLFNADIPAYIAYLHSIDATVPSLGVKLTKVPVRDVNEIEAAIGAIGRQRGGGLMCLPDPFLNVHRKLIVDFAARYRLPAVYSQRFFATAGGLMSYGVDVTDLWRRAVPYVDRILKGTRPGDLPVQQPTKFEFVINLRAANALGLDVPPTLLARADEVIE
jgi:putative ABC transport system substrate-binding protein